MRTNSKLLLLICSIWMLSSCDTHRIYENNINFVQETWHKDSIQRFEVEIPSNHTAYNIYINCRVTGQYQYANLYLFVETQIPGNKLKRDTVECILAEPSGKWIGKGFGNVWSYQIPYKKYVRFPETGSYVFSLQQAMREDELAHILDAGIRVEEATR